MRPVLSPRWLALHALATLLVLAFLGMGWWQLGRGMSGNVRSFGYALEWPAFAIFVVVVWWRTVRDALTPPEARDPASEPAAPPGAPLGVSTKISTAPLPDTRPVPDPGEADTELVAYNRYLTALHTATGDRSEQHR